MMIRKVELKDLDKIIKMGSGVKEFETSDEVVGFWLRHVLESLVDSSKNIFLVAEDGEEVIGFLIVNYNEVFRKAIIENVYVDDKFRKSGVGKKLLEKTVDELKKLDVNIFVF